MTPLWEDIVLYVVLALFTIAVLLLASMDRIDGDDPSDPVPDREVVVPIGRHARPYQPQHACDRNRRAA